METGGIEAANLKIKNETYTIKGIIEMQKNEEQPWAKIKIYNIGMQLRKINKLWGNNKYSHREKIPITSKKEKDIVNKYIKQT